MYTPKPPESPSPWSRQDELSTPDLRTSTSKVQLGTDLVKKSRALTLPSNERSRADSPYESIVMKLSLHDVLWYGAQLWKIPHNGKGLPDKRMVMIKRGGLEIEPERQSVSIQLVNSESFGPQTDKTIVFPPTLIWFEADSLQEASTPSKKQRELVLLQDTHVVSGHSTPAFQKSLRGSGVHNLPAAELCFSVVTSTRSLDLAAESVEAADVWKQAVSSLLTSLFHANKRGQYSLEATAGSAVKTSLSYDGTKRSISDPQIPQQLNRSMDGTYAPTPPTSAFPGTGKLGLSRASTMPPLPPATMGANSNIKHGLSAPASLVRVNETTESLRKELFECAQSGSCERIEQILELKCGVDVNDIDPVTTDTALMMASREGWLDVVTLCLKYGGKNDPHPDYGQTALHVAVMGNHDACATELLQVAALSNFDTVIVNLTDNKQRTALHIACLRCNAVMTDLLIGHGADVTVVESSGHTALHLAARSGSKACLAILLDHSGDICLEYLDSKGSTPLHLAAEQGCLSCVRLLLETAANANACNNANKTPYDVAQDEGHHDISLLVSKYHDPSIRKMPPNGRYNKNIGSGPSPLDTFSSPLPAWSTPYQSKPALERCTSFNDLPRPHTQLNTPAQSVRKSTTAGESRQLSFFSPVNTPGLHVLTDGSYNEAAMFTPHTSKKDHHGHNRPSSTVSVTSSSLDYLYKKTGSPGIGGGNNNSNNGSLSARNSTSMIIDNSVHSPVSARERPTPSMFEDDDNDLGSLCRRVPHSSSSASGVGLFGSTDNPNSSLYNNPNFPTLSISTEISSPLTTVNTSFDVSHPMVEPEAVSSIVSATDDYIEAPPLRSFMYNDLEWQVYMTEEGHEYFLEPKSLHSQWYDPLEYGYIEFVETTDLVDAHAPKETACTGTPLRPKSPHQPKSPSPSYLRSLQKNMSKSDDINNNLLQHAVDAEGDAPKKLLSPEVAPLSPFLERNRRHHRRKSRERRERRIRFQSKGEESDEDDSSSSSDDDVGHGSCGSLTDEAPRSTASRRKNSLTSPVTNRKQRPSSKADSGATSGTSASSGSPNRHYYGPNDMGKIATTMAIPGVLHRYDNSDNSTGAAGLSVTAEAKKIDAVNRSREVEKDKDSEHRDNSKHKELGKFFTISSSKKVVESSREPVAIVPESVPEAPSVVPKPEVDLSLVLAPYFSLVKSGESLKVVRRKMEFDGISKDALARFLIEADSIAVDVDVDAGHQKEATVTAVQASKGEEEAVEKVSDLKNDSILGKYAKMSSMGVPAPSIAQKMKMDDVEISKMNRLLKAIGLPVVEPKAVLPAATAPLSMTLEELFHDSVTGKYAKMAKMGVPLANVKAKMMLETGDIPKVNSLMIAFDHADLVIAEARTADLPKDATGRRPSVQLQKLHWNTISKDKVEKSIWAQTSLSPQPAESSGTGGEKQSSVRTIKDSDAEELEKLFCAVPSRQIKLKGDSESTSNAVKKLASGESSNPKLKLFVLDPKRAQNIVIVLSQFKHISSHRVLIEAIATFDNCQGKLTVDQLENLVALLPSIPELKRLSEAKTSQHPAEVFLMLASEYFPYLSRRLNCYVICENFGYNCAAALSKAKRIIHACNEILSSDRLTKILQRMLAVGNFMNQANGSSVASGFTLDSLIKLVYTKGVDKKTSILDYVVKSFIDKGEDRLLDVTDDLEIVESACKLSGQDTLREIESIEKNLLIVKKELDGCCSFECAENLSNYRVCSRDATTVQPVDHIGLGAVAVNKLRVNVERCSEHMVEVARYKEIMRRKIDQIVEYFGEDIKSCDTSKVFGVLQQFRWAISASKEVVERREQSVKRNNSFAINSTGQSRTSSDELNSSSMI